MKDLPIIKFQEGLNQKPDPELGGFQTLENIDLVETGIAKPTKIDSNYWNIGSKVHSLGLESLLSTQSKISSVGTTLYVDGLAVKTDFADELKEYTSQSGRIYVTGETDGLWYYSGGTMYRAGSPAPTTAPTVGDSAGGSFNGTYTVVVTFTNANGYDSNPSPVGTSGALTTQVLDITNIPVNSDADYNITGRKLWIKGGTTPLYSDYVLLDTIADNTTTSSTGLDTTDVDPTTILETDNDLPPACKYIVNHYDTLFMAGNPSYPNTLYFSKAGKGEQWPTAQAFKLDQPGHPITAIKSWNGIMWGATNRKIYQIIGSPGLGDLVYNFYPKETMATKGVISSRSVVATPYGAFYEADDQIYKFNGVTSEDFSDEVFDIIESRNSYRVTCSAFWSNRVLFSLATGTSTVPNVTIQYDFETKKWTSYDRGFNDMVVDTSTDTLYCATSTGIDVFCGGSTYSDWTIKTKNLSESQNSYHSWGKVQVDMEGSCTMNLYLDDTLYSTETLSATTRQFVTRRFSNQLAHTAAVELVGGAKTSQDKIYSITVSAEPQRGQI